MTKKKILKLIPATIAFIIMLAILWSRAHINYNQISGSSDNMQGESEEITFPNYINEKISDGLIFDAEVITGDNFNPDNFYESTATMLVPDGEKWKQLFGVDDTWSYDVYETTSRTGDTIDFQSYTNEAEDTLYLTSEDALWAKDNMTFIYNILDTNEYSPLNNAQFFAEKTDLSFANQEDNLNFVLNEMKEIGIDPETLGVHYVYYLSADRLEEQEKIKVAAGDIEEREKKGTWSEADEAYYYYLDEMTQGLPVYSAKYVNDYAGDEQSQIIVCTGEEGLRYLSMKYYFLFDIGTHKVQFAPIDKIKECITKKYEKVLDESCVTVTKMKLGVYPLTIEKDRNNAIPVWICTLERKLSGSEGVEKIYLPVNAITGEEFYDMEG